MSVERISYFPRRDGKLPPGARYVGRPSRWGNPHRLAQCKVCGTDHTPAEAVDLFRQCIPTGADLDAWLEPLRGATALGCACPIGEPCHADLIVDLLAEVTR